MKALRDFPMWLFNDVPRSAMKKISWPGGTISE
jgi:hypothetical protein